MSVTTAIENISNHLKNAYNELQGLGADLTNVNKNIENISMVLDGIYDSMPQVSGEDTSLTLDNTRVGKIKSVLKGNTSQSNTPTPTSPIPINIVSGNNKINVVGKNVLNNTNYTMGSIDNDTGQNTSSSVNYRFNEYNEISGSKLYLTKHLVVMFYDTNKGYISYDGSGKLEIDIPNNAKYFRARTFQTDFNTFVASDYQAFTEYASYPISLGNIELCKIGTYKDRIYPLNGKWYLEKKIGKVVLNGTEEGWNVRQGSNPNLYIFYLLNNSVQNSIKENGGFSNYFIENTTSGLIQYDGGFRITEYNSVNRIYLCVNNNIATTIPNFKTWLSTHNTELYYPLATPTTEEITESNYPTLYNQLNALEQAMSYDDQTNISQENDNLPFIINATALMKNSD